MDLKIVENVVFSEITRFLCAKSKNTYEGKWFNYHFYVYAKLKNYLWNLQLPGAPDPLWVPPPPNTRQTSIFLFHTHYTSMETKNKFLTFYRSINQTLPVLPDLN